MGVQTCSLAIIGSLQVEYSSWRLTLVSLTFRTCLLLQWVLTKLPHLTFAWMVKEKLPLESRVYIGVLHAVSSFKPYYYHELERCVTSVTMVTLLHSSTSLLPFQYGKHDRFPYMYIEDFICLSRLLIKMTFPRWIIWRFIIKKL